MLCQKRTGNLLLLIKLLFFPFPPNGKHLPFLSLFLYFLSFTLHTPQTSQIYKIPHQGQYLMVIMKTLLERLLNFIPKKTIQCTPSWKGLLLSAMSHKVFVLKHTKSSYLTKTCKYIQSWKWIWHCRILLRSPYSNKWTA